MCVCACVRVCVCACVRACVRVCVRVCERDRLTDWKNRPTEQNGTNTQTNKHTKKTNTPNIDRNCVCACARVGTCMLISDSENSPYK